MSFGWQINNGSGVTIVDSSMRTGLILGRVQITSGNQSGNLTNSDFQYGTPFSFLIPKYTAPSEVPTVAFSGTPTNTMTWTAGGGEYLGYIWYGIW